MLDYAKIRKMLIDVIQAITGTVDPVSDESTLRSVGITGARMSDFKKSLVHKTRQNGYQLSNTSFDEIDSHSSVSDVVTAIQNRSLRRD